MGSFAALFRGNAKTPQRAAGLNLQTSVYGRPIALIYGVTRASGNLLLYGNFISSGGPSSSGGKGGLFSQGSQNSYTYSATLAFALCEGPITGINQVWEGQAQHLIGDLGFSLFSGTFPQTAWNEAISWSYDNAQGSLVSGSVVTQLGYNGIAYVAAASFNLQTSPSMPNLQYEVQGLKYNTANIGGGDADPSLIVTDLLTNANHGLGFPSAKLGSLTNYQAYCQAAGLVVSPCYDTQRTAADIIDELALATNSAPVWTSGKFTLIPYGDMALSANSATYTPPVVIYALTDSDFILAPQGGGSLSGGASGPVVMERKRGTDKTNSVKIEFLDRASNYAPSIAYANDQDLIDRYGLRSNGSRQMHLFCSAAAANLSAHLQLRRLARISNTYYFDLDQRYILLDPMDIVQITDSNLGLNAQQVRITQIQENDNGTLSFVAEEYLGTQGQPIYNFGSGTGYNTNPDGTASAVNLPIIFEPPSALLGGQGTNPQIWIACCGGSTSATDTNWGGANVTISINGANFRNIGRITAPARMGLLTAPIAQWTGTGQDNTDVLTVDLTQSGGTLASGTQLDAQLGNTLCVVGGELLSYQTATLISGNLYNLTGLYRGLYGTNNSAHAIGSQFARLDDAIFKANLTPAYVNQILFIEIQSMNVHGRGLQKSTTIALYEYVPAGVAMLHPMNQALNAGPVDNGFLAGIAAVQQDCGYVTSIVPDGTIYYMPIATDLGSLAGAFSAYFTSGPALAARGNHSAFAPQNLNLLSSVGTPDNTILDSSNAKVTIAFWVNRVGSSFNSAEAIAVFGGSGSASTTPSSASSTLFFNPNFGNMGIGFSSLGAVQVFGSNLTWSYSSASTAFVSFGTTNWLTQSTVLITSSGWHQITVKYDQSSAGGGYSSVATTPPITIYVDNSTSIAAGNTFLSSQAYGLAAAGGTPTDVLFGSSVNNRKVNLKAFSGYNPLTAYVSEYNQINLQALTSTSFTGSSLGPPLQLSTFGVNDIYLNFAIAADLGFDFSGHFNNLTPSTNLTSTAQTTIYP